MFAKTPVAGGLLQPGFEKESTIVKSLFRCLLFFGAVMTTPAAFAQTSGDSGRVLLEKHCGGCHAVGRNDVSRHASAPPFREILKRYEAQMLAEALAEGLSTGHPDMPEFTFDPEQVRAIVQYLDRLAKE